MRTTILISSILVAGVAQAEPPPATLQGYVSDPIGNPVAGATVLIVGPTGFDQQVETDGHGEYRATLRETGAYHAIFISSRSRDTRQVIVAPGSTNIADGNVDPNTGEVIVIHDRPPPPMIARSTRRPIPPPYSDYAVLHNKWARAWVLLDIDASGTVLRMKFLKHPGADLESIATKYALETKFEPARNAAGQPIRSRLVWGIEWPSWYWLIYRTGTATEVPPSMGYVPCEGSGPLNLDMGNREGTNSAVYRDCSTPNLSRAAREPWIAGSPSTQQQ